MREQLRLRPMFLHAASLGIVLVLLAACASFPTSGTDPFRQAMLARALAHTILSQGGFDRLLEEMIEAGHTPRPNCD